VGYKVSEIVPTDMKAHRAIELLYETFQTFQATLAFVDVDVPQKQQEMLQLYSDVVSTELADFSPVGTYLTNYYFWLGQKQQRLREMNMTPPAGISLEASPWPGCMRLAPLGLATSDKADFYEHFREFLNDPLADVAYTNEFSYYKNKKIEFSFFAFLQKNLKGNDEYIRSIQQVQEKIDRSPLRDKAYVYGNIFVFWEVFRSLDMELIKVACFDVGAIFLCSALLLPSITAAALTTLACIMIVVQVFGIGTLFLNFNMFVAASSLMCMGLAIEFTAHTVAAFSHSSGHTAESIADAVSDTFPAIWDGSITTLLSILPVAFSTTVFEVKYFFASFALIVLIGAINGFIILPGLLALFGDCIKRQRSPTPDTDEVTICPTPDTDEVTI